MTGSEFRQLLREAYDQQARDRDAGVPDVWKVKERENFLSMLVQEQKHTLIEIGSGPGRDGKFFKDRGLDVVCIDLSPEMIKLCREKGLVAHVMDMADLKFPQESFDAAYALNSLLHLSKAEVPEILWRIKSILKYNGLFFMGVYGGADFEGIWEEDKNIPKRFFSYYTDSHILLVLSEMFEIVSFKQISIERRDNLHFQSILLRKKLA